MNNKKFKIGFFILVFVSSSVWAQWSNPRSVTEIEIEDIDVNFWSLMQDGHVYMKRGQQDLIQIKAKGNKIVSEEVIKTTDDDYYIEDVVYYRSSRVFLIEYLDSMSNKELNTDLDDFLKTKVLSNPNRCPKVYTKAFVLPSELMTTGYANYRFPELLLFEPLSFNYDSEYGLVFKFRDFELPLQELMYGINKSNVVFVEYYCKAGVS